MFLLRQVVLNRFQLLSAHVALISVEVIVDVSTSGHVVLEVAVLAL